MIETTRGTTKRRFSDNERICERQTILNMSMCKLQKDQERGRGQRRGKEVPLRRLVLINNTAREIEMEMEKESRQTSLGHDSFLSFSFNDETAHEWSVMDSQTTTTDVPSPPPGLGLAKSQAVENMLTNQEYETTIESPVDSNRFGTIGDGRKKESSRSESKETLDSTNASQVGIKESHILSSHDLERIWKNWDVPLPPLSSFEQSHAQQSNNFGSGLLSLGIPSLESFTSKNSQFADSCYNVDSSPSWMEKSRQDQNSVYGSIYNAGSFKSFPNTCASEFERGNRQGDPFFDELDQIMQVLVGM